jgi:antitoxin HicB
MDKKHCGSSLDSLLEEMGALQDMNERLSKRIFVEQLREAIKRRRISLSEFARRMSTSATAARRLLDHTVPGVTLGSLVSASTAVGMAFEPRLIEPRKQATYLKKYGVSSGHEATSAVGKKQRARRRA